MNTIYRKLDNTIYSKDVIAHATVCKFVEDIKLAEKKETYWKDVAYVRNELNGMLNYIQGLLLYDLTYRKYYSIKKDLHENRITEKDIEDLIDKANAIRKIFNKSEVFFRIKHS